MKYSLSVDTPIGKITVTADDHAVTGVTLPGEEPEGKLAGKPTPLLEKAAGQLLEYFRGERKKFDLPLNPAGTAFQRKVWRELERIPFGTVATYGEIAVAIAEKAELPRMSAQAVGGAVGHNPISLIIPCHRVVGANGNLTDYAGGLDRKIRLLALEGADLSKFFISKTQFHV